MSRSAALLSMLLVVILNNAALAHAEAEVVASLAWSNAKLPGLAVLRHDRVEGPILEVNVNRKAILSLWSLDQPQVENATHAIRGRIRVEAVSGDAQFEMWTCFGDDGDWYSLTPINSRRSSQQSEWLDFEVPFDLGGDYTPSFPPNKMLLTLSLPEGGLLWISNLDLVHYPK